MIHLSDGSEGAASIENGNRSGAIVTWLGAMVLFHDTGSKQELLAKNSLASNPV